ncbi:Gag protease polyprotein-like protein [Gossypium australe]|uniref:Gag protease polyprotein-like protein n=1 Tax=Gossypium australe TaxID=47621 RepID=A0A5B6X429_9ROSI|nr:Gag protease polyprotein-like protein [Gossypium australe]
MIERSKARAPARAYAIRAREEASTPDVIVGTFSIFYINVYALIDPKSSHSYICTTLPNKRNLPFESTNYTIRVTNSLGQCVLVNKICRTCPLKIWGYYFPANLMLLPFDDFDLNLGMDWLTEHDIILKCQDSDLVCVNACGTGYATNIILALLAQKLIRKVKELADVFPDELLGLPSIREVEFVIELVLGIAPILIAPYKMATIELKELKTQL